jgi:hypothetical protein
MLDDRHTSRNDDRARLQDMSIDTKHQQALLDTEKALAGGGGSTIEFGTRQLALL